ncbi:MAG: TRAP transporter substrate-binding protein [Alphaproteobacteria bacterium]|nr:TRAP transporter substrate-binding protein [Alphaproteobacteria bacterium]
MISIRRRTVVASALAAGAAAAAQPARAQQVTLRIHHFLPPQAPVPAGFIEPWAKRVQDQSGGRLKVEIYPAMQLGGRAPALFDQAKDGVVDIIWTLTGYTPDRFPKSEVFDLPFICGNAEQTSRAAWTFYERHLRDEYRDVHVLAVHAHGPGLLHVRGNGVRKLEDMRGLKLRAPTRVISQLLEALGAVPVPMPVPQVPEALQRGVIDGTVVPWEVTRSLRIPELVQSHTDFSGTRALYTTLFVFAMNKARYDSLPADLRKVIDDNSGAAAANELGRVMDAGDLPAIEVAKARKNAIITLDAAETKRWQEAAQRVIDAWIADAAKRGFDGKALVDDLRGLVAQHAGPAG